MKRCKYELFVEKYFGLNPNTTTEKTPINTDFGNIVNMISMFTEEQDGVNRSPLLSQNPHVIKPLPNIKCSLCDYKTDSQINLLHHHHAYHS